MVSPAQEPLRVLAHPLRARLHRLLSTAGPATATTLAGRLGTNTGATSYHLRRLHAAGLIEETACPPTAGRTGRRRYWQASNGGLIPRSPTPHDPDGAASLAWLDRDVLRHVCEQAERWLDEAEAWPTHWRQETRATDALVLVSADQLTELRRDLAATVARYARVGQGNPQAKRVAVYSLLVPLDPDRPPADPGRGPRP